MFRCSLHFASLFFHIWVLILKWTGHTSSREDIFLLLCGRENPGKHIESQLSLTGLRASGTLGIMKGVGGQGVMVMHSHQWEHQTSGLPATPDGKKGAIFFCPLAAPGEPPG